VLRFFHPKESEIFALIIMCGGFCLGFTQERMLGLLIEKRQNIRHATQKSKAWTHHEMDQIVLKIPGDVLLTLTVTYHTKHSTLGNLKNSCNNYVCSKFCSRRTL